MSKPVITVEKKDSIFKVCKIMAKHNIGSLVVVRDHKPVGIITERDVVNKVIGKGKDPSKVLVEEAMTEKVTTIDIHTKFLQAAHLMKLNNFRRLVIMDADQIAGIITARDLIRMMSL